MSIDHRVVLGAEAQSAREARQFVASVLRDEGIQAPSEVALMTSELASNAILHAATSFTVTVEAEPGHIVVDVEDGNQSEPTVRDQPVGATNGRGLFLVDALATSWGIAQRERGKSVWFELRWA